MKQFKDILSEVGQPKAPEEKRFKDQHEIERIDHPVALDHQFTGDIEGLAPKKRPADNAKGDDAKAYDKAYRNKISQTLPKRGNTIVIDDEELADDFNWTEEEIDILAEEVAKFDQEDLTEEELEEIIELAVKAIDEAAKMSAKSKEWYNTGYEMGLNPKTYKSPPFGIGGAAMDAFRKGRKDAEAGKPNLTESSEELEEIIGKVAKAIGRGIKRQTIDRFTTSGQADRAERQADKAEKKLKAKERIKAAQERLKKAQDAMKKAKDDAQEIASESLKYQSITEILGFKNKKPGDKSTDDDAKDDDPNDDPFAFEGYDESACVEDMVKLHASGCSKNKMYEKIKEKYGCSKSTFEGLYASNCMGEEKVECEKCAGKGCDHCNETGYHEEDGEEIVTEVDAADTLDDQPAEAPKAKSDKLSPTSVEIGAGGKKIKVTFKEMLDKISTEEELLESPQEEIPMMLKQLHFICYASEEISEYLKSGVDPEEWWQNKLAEVFSNVKSLYAWSKGDQLVNPKPISAAAMFDKAGILGFAEGLQESSIRVSGNKLQAKPGQATLDNGKRVKVDKDQAQLLNDFFKQLKPNDAKDMASKLLADEESFDEVLQFAEITIGG